jgi:hypothetical protein
MINNIDYVLGKIRFVAFNGFNFIDFEKAFDSVHRHSLWKILRHYGIPQKVVNIIALFYKDFSCNLKNSNKTFPVKSGVRQGCVMSAFLFNLTIDWILKNTIDKTRRGIRWTTLTELEDLDFTDDIALLSHKYEHIQEKSTKLNNTARTIGLKINTGKTKVMTNGQKTIGASGKSSIRKCRAVNIPWQCGNTTRWNRGRYIIPLEQGQGCLCQNESKLEIQHL